jgi:hypothetical protein
MGKIRAHYGQNMGKLWAKYGHTMGKIWVHYGENMSTLWANYGQNMSTLWANYGQNIGKIWAHYGHNMGKIWVRGQYSEGPATGHLDTGFSWFPRVFNPLTPNVHYSGRTAPLTSRRFILDIYSTNICTEYFIHAA